MNNKVVIVVSIVLAVSVIVNGYLYVTLVETENDLTAQINDLNSNIEDLNSNIDSFQFELNETSSERDSLQSEVNILSSEKNRLLTDIENLTDNVAELTLEKNNLTTQVFNLTNEVKTYVNLTDSLNTTVNTLNSTVNNLTAENEDLETEVSSLNEQIAEAKANNTNLENQIDKFESVLTFNSSNLQTLVFHISEKNWTTIPDVSSTYNEILSLNNGTYDIVLLPEIEEHKNWTTEQEWIENNFQEIPIMLETFSSSPEDTPIKLSIENLTTALTKFDIEYLRFAEPISWHIEHNITFPDDYVESILDFCITNNLTIFWTEWKTDHKETNTEVFKKIEKLIEGYEDIVTVSFSTNSGEAEPFSGFLNLDEMFPHWGASIQAWYWDTRYGEPEIDKEFDMPIQLLTLHTSVAQSTGAEIIQFEPYWYFFNSENGENTENLEILFTMLKYNP